MPIVAKIYCCLCIASDFGIRKITPDGEVSTIATSPASLFDVKSVAVGSDGVIYVADSYHGRIRKIVME